jgi:exonuclease SbcD
MPAVIVGHLALHGAEPAGSERASFVAHEPRFSVGQLALPNVDYVALGHIHRFQDRNRAAFERGEGPPVVYSSSVERISFKEHDAQKGFVLIDIEPGKRTTYEFVETPARRFVPIDVDARSAVDPTQAILAEIDKRDVTDAVVRVRYRVTEAEAPLVDAGAVREALRPAGHVAEVVRIIEERPQRRPALVRRETSLEEAIRLYAARHEGLEAMADEMVATALELDAAIERAG